MKQRLLLSLCAVLAAAAVLAQAARAETGGGYDLSWFTIDSGGGTSTAGVYSLSGTIGQADAGAMTGGVYALQGGFWGGALANPPSINLYLPLVRR